MNRSSLAKQLIAGITACCALGAGGELRADNELQLQAPLNSTLTIGSAKTNWRKRPPTMESKPAPEPKQRSAGDSIQAIPASGPLDLFRKAAPSKTRASARGSQGDPLPPQQDVEKMVPGAKMPIASGAWQNRTTSQPLVGVAVGDLTVPEPSANQFRVPVRDGSWVARDAINRIAPLRDPGQHPRPPIATTAPSAIRTQASAPAAKPQLVAPSAKPAPSSPLKNLHGTGRSLSEQPLSEQPPKRIEPSAKHSEAKPIASLKAESLKAPEASKPKEWADEVLDSLLEPEPEKQDWSPKRVKSLELSSPGNTAGKPKANSIKPNLQIPKRTPFRPEAEAGLLRSRSNRLQSGGVKSAPAPTKMVTPKTAAPIASKGNSSGATAFGSVGDLDETVETERIDYTGRTASEIRLTRSVAGMRRGIEQTLRYFYDRPEIATGRSNWGMMHSMMVFGTDTRVIVGRKKMSAIAWIAGNNNCRGQRLLTNDSDGIVAKSGAGLQGHQGQFLAVMGMCNVPLNYPLHAGKVKYNVGELLEAEKRNCRAGAELTFTLIGLSHYMDTDSSWIADDGTRWDFERLIAEELKQPIVGAACGGTHRLMGYTHALRKRRAEGKPINGQWRRAEIYTADFINYAYSLQNRDGSMSTKWFEGRADNGDVDRKVQTTGHIVEWLLTLTPDDQLQNPRLVRAVNFLLRSVGSDLRHDWSIGPKGHALRSLAMYHQRVFQSGSPWVQKGNSRVATGTSAKYR